MHIYNYVVKEYLMTLKYVIIFFKYKLSAISHSIMIKFLLKKYKKYGYLDVAAHFTRQHC